MCAFMYVVAFCVVVCFALNFEFWWVALQCVTMGVELACVLQIELICVGFGIHNRNNIVAKVTILCTHD